MNRGLLVAIAGGAGLVVLGSAIHPVVASTPQPPAVTVEPVESSRLVCPDPLGTSNIDSTVSGFVAPGLKGQSGQGKAAIATVPTAGSPIRREPIPGAGVAVSISTTGKALPPVVGTGEGSLAPGLALDQYTLSSQSINRGLASMECFPAGTDQWFVGGGSVEGRVGEVSLANPEDTPATVDVLLWGPDGPLPAPAGRGVFVPAHGKVRLPFSVLAPGIFSFTIHVESRSGRVTAAVLDHMVHGLIPRGLEWVPLTTPPSLQTVVAGIPAKVDPVLLSVLSPDRDATVKVRLITPQGTFAPAGLTSISLNAGNLWVGQVAKILRGQPAAIELTSTSPIVAGVWYRIDGQNGEAEFAYAAGAPALTGPAVVAGMPTASGYRHRLYLSNNDRQRDSSVVVSVTAKGGRTVNTTLRVPRGTTQVWTIPAPGQGPFSLVVTPTPGAPPIHAARVTSLPTDNGTMVTGVPLTPVRSKVVVPQAQPNLGVTVS